MGFRGSNASGRRIVLLLGAFWAHGASKMAILGASVLLCILQCFRVWEGMLPLGACRMSHASARRIVSCRGLCVSFLCSQIPLAPAPTFGGPFGPEVFRECPSGCLWDPSNPELRSVQKVPRECPRSARTEVPGHLFFFDTPETLSGHSLDTPEPRLEGPQRHPERLL